MFCFFSFWGEGGTFVGQVGYQCLRCADRLQEASRRVRATRADHEQLERDNAIRALTQATHGEIKGKGSDSATFPQSQQTQSGVVKEWKMPYSRSRREA
jgi:hypothetical protein